MAQSCPSGQFWDFLVRRCMTCKECCEQDNVISSCQDYCESLKCQRGQYYDRLLKTCVSCSAVCSQHPPECSQHCTIITSTPTQAPLVTKLGPCSPALMGLEISTLLVYSLLAVSLLLLFLSLSLALVIFLRGDRKKVPQPRSQEAIDMQESIMQHPQEDGQPLCSQGTATSYSRPTEREPSDDSIPTETCVCIHCFPDVKSVTHSGERPYVLYPNLIAQKASARNDTAHQTDLNFAAKHSEHAVVR